MKERDWNRIETARVKGTSRPSRRTSVTTALALVVLGHTWSGAALAQEAEAEPEAPVAVTTAAEIPPPPPPPPPPPAAAREELVLLFTSDLDGRLADGPCDAQPDDRAFLPRIAAAVGRERGAAASAGLQPPVLLDTGDGLYPSPLLNDIGERPESAAALAQALRRTGYDALALGDLTTAVPRAGLFGVARAARTAGVPFLASNFVCGEDADEQECQSGITGQVSDHVIVVRGDLRIGVANILPVSLATSIPVRTLAGAELRDAVEAAREQVRALRQAGVNAVVLISQLDTAATAPRNTLELLSALEGDDRPDVALAASLSGMVVRMHAPGSGTPVLATPSGTLGRALLQRVDGRWIVEDATSVELPATGDPALTTTVSGWNGAFCRDNAQPLARGQLAAELDRAAFAQLVLRSMREQNRAEIAFINRRAIAAANIFPLHGQLTAAQVQRALPFTTEIRTATVRGADMAVLAPTILDSPAAYSVGIERVDDVLLINGRPVNPDGRYRIATTLFVSRGGDGIVTAEAARWREAPAAPEGENELDARVVRWLQSERSAEPYNPDQPLNLHRRALWYGSLTIDGGLSLATVRDNNWVDNDDGSRSRRYDQAQLNRQGVLDLRMAAEGRFGLTSRGHAWDNLLRLQYGRQRLETEVGSDDYDWAESNDLILFRSAYDMDYLRDVVLDGAWYGPTIFLEYQLESEFYHERSAGDEDSPHFLEMTGLLGLKLKPNAWFRLSVAGGIRSMVTDPDPYPVPGLSVRAEIVRTSFSTNPRVPIYIAAYIDYFVGWPVAVPDTALAPTSGSALHKLTGELRVEVTLVGPLRLMGMVRGFLYDENPGTVAMAFDTLLGLTVALSSHTQSF